MLGSRARLDVRQRCLVAASELPGILIVPEMPEIEPRLVAEGVVAAQHRDRDPVAAQYLRNRRVWTGVV
jgi:hypothetical protein